MRTNYEAFEFTTFMDAYLHDHPEVVEDQQLGWDIYWNPSLSPQGQQTDGWGDEVPDLSLFLEHELHARFVPAKASGCSQRTNSSTVHS
jgi:hypothetical protein